MKKDYPLMQPLSEQEINWLGDYLDKLSETYEDNMSLEMIDGLFCALIISPILVDPSDWLDIILMKILNLNQSKKLKKYLVFYFAIGII